MSGCEQPRQILSLLDHIGAGEQWGQHVEAERFRGLEINHKLVLGRLLYPKIGGLLALEDAIDMAGGSAMLMEGNRCRRR